MFNYQLVKKQYANMIAYHCKTLTDKCIFYSDYEYYIQ